MPSLNKVITLLKSETVEAWEQSAKKNPILWKIIFKNAHFYEKLSNARCMSLAAHYEQAADAFIDSEKINALSIGELIAFGLSNNHNALLLLARKELKEKIQADKRFRKYCPLDAIEKIAINRIVSQ